MAGRIDRITLVDYCKRSVIVKEEPAMLRRVAFVTIGQSPRSDVLPDIIKETQTQFEVTERGALDGLTDEAIVNLAPQPGEERLVTRLRDGREVLLGKPAIDRRLHTILAELDQGGSTCWSCCVRDTSPLSVCARRSSSPSIPSITSFKAWPMALNGSASCCRMQRRSTNSTAFPALQPKR
jgi:hypothetical protein